MKECSPQGSTPCFHCLKRHLSKSCPTDEKWRTIFLVSCLLTWAQRTGSIYNLLWQATPTAYEKKYHFFLISTCFISTSFSLNRAWTAIPWPPLSHNLCFYRPLLYYALTEDNQCPFDLVKANWSYRGSSRVFLCPTKQKKLWRWGEFSKIDIC